MAHIHEKIDFTTSVYIVQDGKVLLHKHKILNMWLPPGGHIELDEDPNIAAVREVKEESGFDVELIGNPRLPMQPKDASRDLIPPMFLNRHPITEIHEHLDLVYFGKVIGGEMQSEFEGGEIGWFSKEDIEKKVQDFPDVVGFYALAAIQYFEQRD